MDAQYKGTYRRLGLNIAYYRKLRELTQDSLAEKADIDRTTIGKLETAAVGASLDMIFSIADALDVEPYKLFVFRD